jgi:nucleotide-binding universal stress UspA family protein
VRKPFGSIDISAEEVTKMVTELAMADLDRAVSHWSALAKRTKITKSVVTGDAASVILDAAKSGNVDLIAMASSGRGAIGRLTLGSVADRVIRTAEHPVLVVRGIDAPATQSLPEINRVVVPLDGSDRALRALPVAATAAAQLKASVELISAVDLPQVVAPALSYGPAFEPEIYAELEAQSTTNAEAFLQQASTQLADLGVNAQSHVMHGPAAAAILDFAKHGDLIVMTSRGQGGIKRWLLGSVAEKLIRDAHAPLLLVPVPHTEE